jgi:hypothetical protein
MSKLNFVHSSDLTSSTLMQVLLSVQVLPRIEKNPLDICVTDGD